MPRVETVVPDPGSRANVLSLDPDEIQQDLETAKARPDPQPDETASLAQLAASMADIGQIVPVVVDQRDDGYFIVDGRRRLAAAKTLEDFKLLCVVRGTSGDPLKTAIHANLKRKGYTPVQFAHICEEVRKANGWTGTKEVAEYLGVSRAQVSQHDKLLSKPEGIDDKTYRDLVQKVASGKMGADAAFYTLTHVDPAKAEKVLERAEASASKEAGAKADKKISAAPSSRKEQQTASKPKPLGPKPTARQKKAFAAETKALREQHKKRVAADKIKKAAAIAKAKEEAKIEKKHLKEAAREEKAIKSDLQRSLPDLRALFAKLSTTAYPDVMRNFISQLDTWLRGDATDREVSTQWGQIALLAEAQLENTRSGQQVKAKTAGKKAASKAAKKAKGKK
jgi:ParB/RepB/Spo0J family partition protein